MSPLLIALMVIGALIIAGLAFYAGTLLWRLKLQREAFARQEAEYAKAREVRNGKLADSINLIARAMKEKQCEYSEGCLRVWVLMSQYQFFDGCDPATEFPAILKMYDVVKEMPTHEARKKYSKKEIFKLDSERWRAEMELEEQIMADVEKLLGRFQALSKSEHVVFG